MHVEGARAASTWANGEPKPIQCPGGTAETSAAMGGPKDAGVVVPTTAHSAGLFGLPRDKRS